MCQLNETDGVYENFKTLGKRFAILWKLKELEIDISGEEVVINCEEPFYMSIEMVHLLEH